MIALWMVYTLILSTGLALAAAILDRAASGSLRQRRWIWMVALTLSAAVPAWQATAARLGIGRATPGTVESDAKSTAAGAAKSQSVMAELIARADSRSLGGLNASLRAAWAVAALLVGAGYAAATWSLSRRRRTWRESVVDGQGVLIADATGPAVIGAFRPAIVIPEWALSLPDDQRALMLDHERQHLRAKDPILLQTAALVVVLMPWNVVAWWLVRRLRLAVELDCDARVLAAGRDLRAYGTLLLDVCARRVRSGVVLSPALFERTSSLTRRIMAMQPDRPRFARVRFTLGAGAALAIVVLACDMPSPEVVAPDGKNQATKRLYGEIQTVFGPQLDTKGLVSTYFPSVAQGEVGSVILFVVRSATGKIVLTESQPTSELSRMREPNRMVTVEDKVALLAQKTAEPSRERVAFARTGTELRMNQVGPATGPEKGVVMFKVRDATRLGVPAGIGAIAPNDIATIDVSKHAAGTAAPNALSIVMITLKPGATIPTIRTR